MDESLLTTFLTGALEVYFSNFSRDGRSCWKRCSSSRISISLYVVIIMCDYAGTDQYSKLDSSLLRPGRLDVHVQIPLPDEQARKQIFQKYFVKHPVEITDEFLDELTKATAGCNVSVLRQLYHVAVFSALRVDLETDKITEAHFKEAMQQCLPSSNTSTIK